MQKSKVLLECSCHGSDHFLLFKLLEWEHSDTEKDFSLSISAMLNLGLPWYKRLWWAFKYVMKGKDDYTFLELLPEEAQTKDIKGLRDLLDRYLELTKTAK